MINESVFRDLDEMLSSLGVAPVSEVLSSLSSVNSAASDHSATHTPDASLLPVNGAGYDRSYLVQGCFVNLKTFLERKARSRKPSRLCRCK